MIAVTGSERVGEAFRRALRVSSHLTPLGVPDKAPGIVTGRVLRAKAGAPTCVVPGAVSA